MSPSKLIQYFSSYPAACGFQSLSPPVNITLNPANKKDYQSLSEFPAGIGAAALATHNTEQIISHIGVALVDTIS